MEALTSSQVILWLYIFSYYFIVCYIYYTFALLMEKENKM